MFSTSLYPSLSGENKGLGIVTPLPPSAFKYWELRYAGVAKPTFSAAPTTAGDSSDLDASGDELQTTTPPDSPTPSTGAFAPYPSGDGLELDDEFYAIPSDPSL